MIWLELDIDKDLVVIKSFKDWLQTKLKTTMSTEEFQKDTMKQNWKEKVMEGELTVSKRLKKHINQS